MNLVQFVLIISKTCQHPGYGGGKGLGKDEDIKFWETRSRVSQVFY